MKLGNLEIDGKVMLAPMAGVSDLSFRTICAEQGAAVTVTEMVSSRALLYQDQKSRGLLKKTPIGICGAQIFGNDPEIMARGAEAALRCAAFDFIDLNMGCPVGKVVKNGDGSALMRDPVLAAAIVEAVCAAVSVPVTVKIRKGWDSASVNAPELSRCLEAAGASAITVHGRTRTMLYSGVADWDIILRVRAAVKIPVIANGDVFSPEAAVRCMERTGVDMVMIGRGSFGNPWIFSAVAAKLAGEETPDPPDLCGKMDVAQRQFELATADKGMYIACLEARKYIAWYLRGVPHSAYYKERLSTLSSAEQFDEIVKGIRHDLT